jgi:hypothetical protein
VILDGISQRLKRIANALGSVDLVFCQEFNGAVHRLPVEARAASVFVASQFRWQGVILEYLSQGLEVLYSLIDDRPVARWIVRMVGVAGVVEGIASDQAEEEIVVRGGTDPLIMTLTDSFDHLALDQVDWSRLIQPCNLEERRLTIDLLCSI